jgi:plastocyanin
VDGHMSPAGAWRVEVHAAAGTLTYHCPIHPFMKGSVEVK